MIQYASRAQLKEKARDQMAGHYGNAILLSICRSMIVFSLTFAVSMTFTMILTVRTLMGGSAETSLTEYLLLTACNTPYPFSWIFGQSRGAIRAMNEFFKTSGMKKLGTVAFAGAKGRSHLPAGIQKRIIHALK